MQNEYFMKKCCLLLLRKAFLFDYENKYLLYNSLNPAGKYVKQFKL